MVSWYPPPFSSVLSGFPLTFISSFPMEQQMEWRGGGKTIRTANEDQNCSDYIEEQQESILRLWRKLALMLHSNFKKLQKCVRVWCHKNVTEILLQHTTTQKVWRHTSKTALESSCPPTQNTSTLKPSEMPHRRSLEVKMKSTCCTQTEGIHCYICCLAQSCWSVCYLAMGGVAPQWSGVLCQ